MVVGWGVTWWGTRFQISPTPKAAENQYQAMARNSPQERYFLRRMLELLLLVMDRRQLLKTMALADVMHALT